MPDRIVELDGVQHHFPSDASDAEIASALKGSAPPVDRGGLLHPLTSMLAPELEGARSALDAATATPHGQPIMARSRTGTLYPSEEGTGAVNAAKGAASGAGGALIDQAEGITSPLGIVTAGAAKGVSALANSPSMRGSVGRAMQFLGNNVDITKPFKMLGKAGEWLEGTAAEAPSAPPPPTGPHMDLSQPIRPGTLTQQQIGERLAAIRAAGGTSIPPTAPKGPLGGRLQMAPTPERPPITVAPESPMQAPAESPMQGPRVQVGAEVVGRQNGLTKEAVRQQTGPILNEAAGEASPVFPEKPFERMHDKLLAMGHGNPDRIDYVKAAADPKTAGLLEAMRRTLERNGLVIGGMTSAEAIRQAVMKRLQGEQP